MRYFFMVISLLAFVSLAIPVGGSQDDERLDALFRRLKATNDNVEGARLTQLIWEIWHQSDDENVNELMYEGVGEMSVRNYQRALIVFNEVVEIAPEFAEGWNKRATVYYVLGKYEASIRDIQRTLALEPRHFGALSGMGLIFLAIGNDGAALEAFQAALKVNPHMPGPRVHVKELRQRIRKKSF